MKAVLSMANKLLRFISELHYSVHGVFGVSIHLFLCCIVCVYIVTNGACISGLSIRK